VVRNGGERTQSRSEADRGPTGGVAEVSLTSTAKVLA
jgi:hypothetical protein